VNSVGTPPIETSESEVTYGLKNNLERKRTTNICARRRATAMAKEPHIRTV